jgi:ATP-dependent RNA helicase RhlB
LFSQDTRVSPPAEPVTADASAADLSAPDDSDSRVESETAPKKNRRRRRPKTARKDGDPNTAQPAAGRHDWDPALFAVEPQEDKVRFHDLDLPLEVLHAIADLGFEYCTPIQAEILPSTLVGMDAFGRAQTGTGKTAAFLITVITRMLRNPLSYKRQAGTPRVLVLAPTRELVMQIAEEACSFCKYTAFSVTTIFGGMDYDKQRRTLSQTTNDIVVATPGRLLDFKRQGDVRLDQVEILIIDEADRMLDMGFIPDVRKIIYGTPQQSNRQTLLFSATLTPEIRRLAASWTKDPVTVEIEPTQVAVDSVDQIVYIVTNKGKHALLYNIITVKKLERVIVFCNRKTETRRLADLFARYNINCAVLSGDVRQQTRVRTLADFKAGKIRVLVATDVAGRGIHIEGMDHVINYTLPRDPEDYVHRIGRTGRAGAAGTSISFADEDDSFAIPAIEELIGHELPCIYPQEEFLAPPPAVSARSAVEKEPGGDTGQGPARRGRSRRRRTQGPGGGTERRDSRPSRPRRPKSPESA